MSPNEASRVTRPSNTIRVGIVPVVAILDDGKVPVRAVLPTAIIMGLLSEALKYAYILALPWLNFAEVYGPFSLSVSLMFWAFLSGLLLLTGAHLSAEEHLPKP